MISKKINLQLFSYTDYGTSEFFNEAFQEVHNKVENDNNISTEAHSEGVEATESASDEQEEQLPIETNETIPDATESVSHETLTREEMLEAIRATQKEPELDAETLQAIELMNYLKENPHLVEAMREINPQAHSELNSYVPNEYTQKLQELEEFMIEQKYQGIVADLKTKYADYDADKVLEYAEQHELSDLEVAYKALKADSVPQFDVEAERQKLREELKAEIMAELKENASNTSTIVTSSGTVPQVQNEVVLSQQEKNVAQAMGIPVEEYVKWRDGK